MVEESGHTVLSVGPPGLGWQSYDMDNDGAYHGALVQVLVSSAVLLLLRLNYCI